MKLSDIVRVRSNRVFYQSPFNSQLSQPKGHPCWYGEWFDLKDDTTWHSHTYYQQTTIITLPRSSSLTLTIKAWHHVDEGLKNT